MNNKTHIPEIISKNRSLLMGVAILMVIMYHAFCCNLPMGPVSHILRYGYLGVDIFIFLSAIGLCYSFEKNNSQILHEPYHPYITIILVLSGIQICL